MLRTKMRFVTLFWLAAALIASAAVINVFWQPFSWALLLQTIVHSCVAGLIAVYALAVQRTPNHHHRYRRSLRDLLSLRFSWMPWQFARLAYALVLLGCAAGLGIVLLILLG
ncbi:hypothetical protein [Herpetosiphon giganteus]|uniref:hypothetical protein n=1 Tax=Herpetosiphon giganteus TaxID=2029754 RepID=UPI001959E825|nr:hypothetical protein [Herpetosiphon giganteus]MBM7842332.1 hypothetical protein [Herpetosiphon giganteus]